MNVKHLLVQSADRITGTPNKFKVPINTLRNVGRVSLLSASIPNTLYNVTSANNSLYFGGTGFHIAGIPPGAYNIYDLIVALETSMKSMLLGICYCG